jgi:hypothetical protein
MEKSLWGARKRSDKVRHCQNPDDLQIILDTNHSPCQPPSSHLPTACMCRKTNVFPLQMPIRPFPLQPAAQPLYPPVLYIIRNMPHSLLVMGSVSNRWAICLRTGVVSDTCVDAAACAPLTHPKPVSPPLSRLKPDGLVPLTGSTGPALKHGCRFFSVVAPSNVVVTDDNMHRILQRVTERTS